MEDIMISKKLILKIVTNSSLLSVAKLYGFVATSKKDGTYLGICPFCKKDTFVINEATGLYRCFYCNSQGNIINFLSDSKKITPREAVASIIKNLGLDTCDEYKECVISERKKNTTEQILLNINRDALIYYMEQLKKSPSESNIQKYVYEKRQLHFNTINQFGLGYAPSNKNDLYNILVSKYGEEMLMLSGLFSYKENEAYPKFWNRLMFPITDEYNNVIAFGGRVLDSSVPKYLNSPNTPIYNKRFHLYGLGKALEKAENGKLSSIIICEGYMDVIAMHQAGYTNAVASLGTALTPYQCDLIKKHTDVVYTSYDSDAPGVEATRKAVKLLSAKHLSVKVLDLSPSKDPDEFIKLNGKYAFDKKIHAAIDAEQWEEQHPTKSKI